MVEDKKYEVGCYEQSFLGQLWRWSDETGYSPIMLGLLMQRELDKIIRNEDIFKERVRRAIEG
ncbi:hypothetical protein J4217_01095 [Candidatus Pacearchaeota archaeon]|nr:hypothetical protein [Candidatus Pacearchaeota archaeon]